MAKALPLIAYPDLESRVNALENDGYVYLPKVINGEEIVELKAAMDRLDIIPESFDKHGTPENDGFLNKHINNAFNREITFLQYLDKPEVIEIEEAIHGKDWNDCLDNRTRAARSNTTHRLAAHKFTRRYCCRSKS